jgi:uncharacterized repeat protein (TIGR02543 family)
MVIMAIAGGAMIVSASTSINQMGSDIDGEAAGDYSGKSVSLSSDGTTVAIGAEANAGAGGNAGHVRIYEWDGTAWTQKGNDIDGEAANDYSGRSVSLSSDGKTVAIGAHLNDGGGPDAGHVRVYEWSDSAWNEKGSDIRGEAADDLSGISVSLSPDGTTVAIGANGNDGNGNSAGHVRVYEWDGTAWTQRGADIDGEAADDQSGTSVSLSSDGTTVAIGAERNGTNAGHVRVYEWDGTAWTQRGADIDGEATDDRSGSSVSLSSDGTTVAIGARLNDGNGTNAGHVRVYKWEGGTWNQKGNDIDGEAASDFSGYSVSLSSDGTIVAIGASGNDDSGDGAGHVRLYKWDGGTWNQKGNDIDGEDTLDAFGRSVSLSSDGTIVAIGAWLNDGNGDNSGHARVYSVTTALSITYDSQGGSAVSGGDATTTVGGTISALPADPTRDGHTFAGWFTAAISGTEITTNAVHNQTADFTLYAQWTENPTTTTTTVPETTTTTTAAPTTTTTTTLAPTTTATTTTLAPTTTVAPTTTTVAPTTTIVLPATGSSNGTGSQMLLVLGIGGLLVLSTRRRLDVRD